VSVLTRKILPPVFGIATIGWIIGGTIWFDKQLNNNNVRIFSQSSSFNSSVVTKSSPLPRSICFNSGSATPIFYSENLAELRNIADYLNRNNHQSLVLTGLSDKREQAADKSINLGFARAEAIKTTLTTFGAPNNSLELKTEQKEHLLDTDNKVCDAVKMAFVTTNDNRFQALNLFFKPNKYRFAETSELQKYFTGLRTFLLKNPTAKLKIATHGSETEGGGMGKNRLVFILNFLKNKKFDVTQFVFENEQISTSKENLANTDSPTQQRLEIRIMTP
jgi:outer membrane protein OmpA-like peptidoglycan-associated protein